MKYLLHVIPEKCDGCLECVYACSIAKHGTPNPLKALIRVERVASGWDVIVCRHCNPAPCIDVCEFNALRVDESTGAVVLNRELCTTCKACMSVCPFEGVWEGCGGAVLKCDLCGGDPACVKACRKGALILGKAPDKGRLLSKSSVDELLRIKGLR